MLAERLLSHKSIIMEQSNGESPYRASIGLRSVWAAMKWTCLVEAVRNSQLHIVKLLCRFKIDVATVDRVCHARAACCGMYGAMWQDGMIPKDHTADETIHKELDEVSHTIL